MKQIKDNKYLSIKQTALDGGAGIIRLPRNNKTGFTKATIIWSWGMDWEHVSVCPLNVSQNILKSAYLLIEGAKGDISDVIESRIQDITEKSFIF